MKNISTRSLVFGLTCAVVGFPFGIIFSLGFTDPSFRYFWIPVVISSFSFGSIFWGLLPERIANRKVLWGVVAGILGSLIAHFSTWLLTSIFSSLCVGPDCAGSLGESLNFWEMIASSFLFGFFSILILGWLTSLVGGVLGGIYAYALQKRKLF